MPTQSQEWAQLLSEYKLSKAAHETIFWQNVNKFTLRFDGRVPEGPTVEEIAKEEKAREALEDIQTRMRAFVEKNT